MTAIGIRFLCGYYASMSVSSRTEAEWPPHPARLFMAMAAAHFETGEDPAERRALEWLEQQAPPALRASTSGYQRLVVPAYVPVNDIESGEGLLPSRRPKQQRTFPRFRPESDTIYVIWSADPDPSTRAALASLCAKVTRLGHPSSLVQAWVVEPGKEPEVSCRPDDMGELQMRAPFQGLLKILEDSFNGAAVREYLRIQEEIEVASPKQRRALKLELKEKFPDGPPRSRRPPILGWRSYAAVRKQDGQSRAAAGPFDPNLLILYKFEGPALALASTLQLTGALRDAVMKSSPQPVPEWISGHTREGTPSQEPHLAFLPLAFVGSDHADGHVMGLAIAIPRKLGLPDGTGREAAIRDHLGGLFFDRNNGDPRMIVLWRQANGQPAWEWTLERESREAPPQTLRSETWTKPSRIWASVTPVVLHHHPKRHEGSVEGIVRQACRTALLPEPSEVFASPVSKHEGAGHFKAMPEYTEGGPGLCRYQTHVTLYFDEPVEGPVLIGRGRYRGYGLFRPWEEENR